jgi:hypothetical protein
VSLDGQEREALEFYADPAQWDGAAEAIWHDSGTRARAALAAREEPTRRFSEREVEAMLEAAHTNAHEPESDDELPLTIEAAIKWAESLLGKRVGVAAREEPKTGKPGSSYHNPIPVSNEDIARRMAASAAGEDTERPDEPTRALEEDVDRAKLARELADVVYISYGTAHAFAIDLDAALREIHRAAMRKLDPATMVVREDGKVMKPPGFVPPDMSQAVRDTEQEQDACKDYFDPDLVVASWRGALCHNCSANGEGDL